ncbi:MAG: Gfo/Idh/MocA family oxidoreductase [Planctomycetota bacterium]
MKHPIDRRAFLEKGAAALAAATVADATTGAQEVPKEESDEPVRIGVVGVGGRGQWHVKNLLSYQENVVIPAICDYRKDRLDRAVEVVKSLKGYTPDGYSKDEHDYLNMLERDDLDAVLVATDVFWLARISIDALKAGKHAGSEVTGCHTVDECWELVKTQESSEAHYMLLENCCYGREPLMIYNMVRQGVFGPTYFATGSYVHDCKPQWFESDGSLSWRGRLVRDAYGSSYPAHGVGTPSKWLGINDGDRMEYCIAMATDPRESHDDAVKRFGPESDQAKIDFRLGDFVSTLIHTAQGKQIRLDYSISSTRPYSRYYLLQGMEASFDSRTGIYVEGVQPHHQWGQLDEFAEKYEHEYWRKDGETARRAGGHGGIDYHCVSDFVKMVRRNRKPWVDAYDCATWSSLVELSRLSLDRKGAPVEIPDFTQGKWEDPDWRKGRMV